MFLTRWKMMAGVLGVSLGGLAAMAGPCAKNDPTKGGPPPEIPVASAPASSPMMPPPSAPVLPAIPAGQPANAADLPLPPAVLPAGGMALPAVPPPGAELPAPPAPASSPPAVPSAPKLESPALPASIDPPARTPAPSPAAGGESIPPLTTPAASGAASPPMSVPADPLPHLDAQAPAPLTIVKPATTAPVGALTAVAQAKYRILLRVGEGEPLFEVRSGDHLILKVVCEKVDVKSPEKGQGLSAVKASGKVRFAGFGAEGTCDELHFLAGTGEVGMSGHVKIQVKDKLGRVESELSADTMRYRIDPQASTGNGLLKP